MDTPHVAARLREAPKSPGVYFWRDRKRRPLYIGKASDLRSRLASYPKTLHPRIRAMVGAAASLDWQTTVSDIEALILESQLIKQWRPKYNIEWRDDKQHVVVALTDGDFPQFIVNHQHQGGRIRKPIREIIGPFTESAPLRMTLRLLRSLFPFCTCPQTHHVRCLNAHIGRCPGYCCLKAPATAAQKTQYRRHVRAIRDILTGRRDTVVRRLEVQMRAAGRRHELERAIELRRQVERIRRVFENAHLNVDRMRAAGQHANALDQLVEVFRLSQVPARIEGYDAANIQQELPTGAMVTFTDGQADPTQYRLFNIRRTDGGDTGMLTETLRRRLRHEEWPLPQLVVVDGGRGQMNATLKVLRASNRDIPVLALTKNDRHQPDHVVSSLDGTVRYLADLPRALRDLLVHVDAEAHRFAIGHYRRRHRSAAVPGRLKKGGPNASIKRRP